MLDETKNSRFLFVIRDCRSRSTFAFQFKIHKDQLSLCDVFCETIHDYVSTIHELT